MTVSSGRTRYFGVAQSSLISVVHQAAMCKFSNSCVDIVQVTDGVLKSFLLQMWRADCGYH